MIPAKRPASHGDRRACPLPWSPTHQSHDEANGDTVRLTTPRPLGLSTPPCCASSPDHGWSRCVADPTSGRRRNGEMTDMVQDRFDRIAKLMASGTSRR
ncbi:MAG: hypothetical protein QOF73_3398, partial [Thermomicrobiales bacterium]|nr:hypothetical protein [Thermomicrobiales bacterium]